MFSNKYLIRQNKVGYQGYKLRWWFPVWIKIMWCNFATPKRCKEFICEADEVESPDITYIEVQCEHQNVTEMFVDSVTLNPNRGMCKDCGAFVKAVCRRRTS